MYNKQKGSLPFTLSLIGAAIHTIFILFSMPHVSIEVYRFFTSLQLKEAVFVTLQLLAFWIGAIWSTPLLIGSFFVAAFPDIRLTEKGIEYRSYKFIRSFVSWREIDRIVNLRGGYKAIVIKRKGIALINGLYSNQIYGDIVKIKRPIILISPNLENLESVLSSIDYYKNSFAASEF